MNKMLVSDLEWNEHFIKKIVRAILISLFFRISWRWYSLWKLFFTSIFPNFLLLDLHVVIFIIRLQMYWCTYVHNLLCFIDNIKMLIVDRTISNWKLSSNKISGIFITQLQHKILQDNTLENSIQENGRNK